MLYVIAEHRVRVSFLDDYQDAKMLSSFVSFQTDDDGSAVLLDITVDDSLRPVKKNERYLIRDVDTGNGMTKVFRVEKEIDGKKQKAGYQFIIRDIDGHEVALLIADEDFHVCHCALRGNYCMRSYGLNSVIMLCYAFATAPLDTCLIHASLVRNEGKGYAFTAKSGTGKSTQVSNWLRFIPGSDLMNDDNPVVRIIDGKAFIYGSPWSGKTPCYRNIKAPLGGIALIKRAESNSLERLRPIDAFITLLPACSTMKWDERIYRCNGDTVTKLIETTPVYNLNCLPDRDSAVVASTGMKAGESR